MIEVFRSRAHDIENPMQGDLVENGGEELRHRRLLMGEERIAEGRGKDQDEISLLLGTPVGRRRREDLADMV